MSSHSTEYDGLAQIKVLGVGGGGCNAVSRMFREKIQGVEYLAINTDAQALMRSDVPVKVRIGDNLTRGLGVGGDPELGRQAAEESRDELTEMVKEADMVFVAAGMGGGTGTGAAPVVAEVARSAGALTIGVVTRPFDFEGRKRQVSGEEGTLRLKEHVDTLITIPNQRLLSLCDANITKDSAFKMADDVLRQGVQAIAELVTVPGDINLDFADVKSIMANAGPAWMAIGQASGENRAVEAARAAAASPLLDVSINGAKGILLNITGGSDLTLAEVEQAAEVIRSSADPEANIIFGLVTDLKMEGEVKVTIIATGFPDADRLSQDDRVSELIRQAFSEEVDLDLPPFLRRPQVRQRRFQNL